MHPPLQELEQEVQPLQPLHPPEQEPEQLPLQEPEQEPEHPLHPLHPPLQEPEQEPLQLPEHPRLQAISRLNYQLLILNAILSINHNFVRWWINELNHYTDIILNYPF